MDSEGHERQRGPSVAVHRRCGSAWLALASQHMHAALRAARRLWPAAAPQPALTPCGRALSSMCDQAARVADGEESDDGEEGERAAKRPRNSKPEAAANGAQADEAADGGGGGEEDMADVTARLLGRTLAEDSSPVLAKRRTKTMTSMHKQQGEAEAAAEAKRKRRADRRR